MPSNRWQTNYPRVMWGITYICWHFLGIKFALKCCSKDSGINQSLLTNIYQDLLTVNFKFLEEELSLLRSVGAINAWTLFAGEHYEKHLIRGQR